MLDAARTMILEMGTAKTTLKAVGERAGYSRGLANARFGNKNVLFRHLARRCFSHWIEALQSAAGEKTGLAALLSRIDAINAYVEHYPDDARVLYVLWFESVGTQSEMREELSRFHDQARADIEALVRAGQASGEINSEVDATAFSMHFTSALFGVSYQWVVNPVAVSIDGFTRFFRENTVRTLASTNGPA